VPGLRTTGLKASIAALCVAVSALLSVQMAQAAVDRVAHATGVAHAPNAVAGAVSLDAHDPAGDHHATPGHHDHHDDDQADPATSGDDADFGGVTHHHHGDNAQMGVLTLGGAAYESMPATVTHARGDTRAPPAAPAGGLDRPPRPLSDRIV
jgi:hypothetical protein